MRITLIFSGLLRILAGEEREVLEVADGVTIEGLSGVLAEKYQNLHLETSRTYFIVNGQAFAPERILSEGDEVRVFQILAGG